MSVKVYSVTTNEQLKREGLNKRTFFLLSKQCFCIETEFHLKNPGLSTEPLRTQTLLLYSKHDFVSKLANSACDGHKWPPES